MSMFTESSGISLLQVMSSFGVREKKSNWKIEEGTLPYVLDASAIIALLRAEPGGDVVSSAMRGKNVCFAHAMNLCEVYYDFHRSAGKVVADDVIASLRASDIWFRSDMDEKFWMEAGVLKSGARRISLADCCALVLARRVEGTLLTADHHEMDPLTTDHRIRFIR